MKRKDVVEPSAPCASPEPREGEAGPAKKNRDEGTANATADAVPPHWRAILDAPRRGMPSAELDALLRYERERAFVFPPADSVFASLRTCGVATGGSLPEGVSEVRVVILGQDPYHGVFFPSGSTICGGGDAEDEIDPMRSLANGLAFSVDRGAPVPPSLENIYAELTRDPAVEFAVPDHGDLSSWAAQGVLLLNTCLTVRMGKPRSHAGRGWEEFTDGVIRAVSEDSKKGVVFLLWGRDAQSKASLIDDSRHLVLKTSHPSPFSVAMGFAGCGHFGRANEWLAGRGQAPVDWNSLAGGIGVRHSVVGEHKE